MRAPRCTDCKSPKSSFGVCDECKAHSAWLLTLHRRMIHRGPDWEMAQRVEAYRLKIERGERLFEAEAA